MYDPTDEEADVFLLCVPYIMGNIASGARRDGLYCVAGGENNLSHTNDQHTERFPVTCYQRA